MAEKTYALYITETGLIVNTPLVEESIVDTIQWEEGLSCVEIPENTIGEWSMVQIGWSYINGAFVEPPIPVRVATQAQPVVTGAQTL